MDDEAQDTDDKDATSTSSIREQDHEDTLSVDSMTMDELADEGQDMTTPSENHENTGVDGCDPPVVDTIESTRGGHSHLTKLVMTLLRQEKILKRQTTRDLKCWV